MKLAPLKKGKMSLIEGAQEFRRCASEGRHGKMAIHKASLVLLLKFQTTILI